MSVNSAICFSVGLPVPWPARVSMRIRMWRVAGLRRLQRGGEFEAVAGTTRSSVSAVVTSVGG